MDENSQGAKISGYLEKKGKKKILASYKKYWFVLEGRLLLYYRSKVEYDAISPCKGSINLGPSCIVKPCASSPGVFQIQNRSSTVTLRAENREEQNKWMQNIMGAIGSNKNPPKLSHFRYSLDDLPKAQKQTEMGKLDSQAKNNSEEIEIEKSNKVLIQRLQKMGAQTYGYPLGTLKKAESSKTCASQEHFEEHNCLEEKTKYADLDHTFLTKHTSISAEHIYERLCPMNEIDSVSKDNSNEMYYNSRKNYHTISNNTPDRMVSRDLNENNIRKQQSSSPNLIVKASKDQIDCEELKSKISNDTKVNKRISKKNSKSAKVTDDEKKPVKIKKCTSFIRRVWERRSKKVAKDQDENNDNDIIDTDNDQNSVDNCKAERMLNELQNILEHKIPNLNVEKFSIPEVPVKKTVPDVLKMEQSIEKRLEESVDSSSSTPSTANEYNISEMHQSENNKSLDEILDELDRENDRNKVKNLIKKFSEQDFNENDVILRTAPKYYPRDEIDSDELSILLNELAKVTNAPILTPGATNSLVGTNAKDIEMSKLLPQKKRRHSEPDYDIPRPHTSILALPRTEETDKIGSTRFFGPVLTYDYMRTIHDESSPENSPQNISMTPDSLEADAHTTRTCPHMATENEAFSYTLEHKPITADKRFTLGQTYMNFGRNYMNDFMIENEMYAEPKSILKYNSLIDSINDKTDDHKDDEVFIDSLEVCNT